MNYALFANPQTGSSILTKVFKIKPPSVVFTIFNNVDNWKRILFRAICGNFTVEDKLRFLYKTEFYDYRILNTKNITKIVNRKKIDIGMITTFSYLIKKDIYECFPLGVFNFHPSLLPLHGGANPFFWIIFNGDKYSGTTCYKINDRLDTGEVFIQSKYSIENLNSKQLFKLYEKDIEKMLPNLLNNYDELKSNSFKIDSALFDPKKFPQLSEINNKFSLERYYRAYKLYKS